MHTKNILIMAGGTGGHIFPALSVARKLQMQQANVIWLGSAGGMEESIIGNTDIKIITIKSRPLRGNLKNMLTAPFYALVSIFSAIKVIKSNKINAVVGFGGFASFAGGIAAWLLRKPLFIHEQNSIMGLTNKILTKFAKLVFVAYPMQEQNKKFISSANPVREDIAALAATPKQINTTKSINLFVFGGSLGALAINEVMPMAIAELKKMLIDSEVTINLVHQAGKNKAKACKLAYENAGIEVEVVEFIENMRDRLQWADIVICRSGAITLAEVSCSQLAAIFIPYPFAVDNHQYYNAKYFVDKNAGYLLPQTDLTANNLARKLLELVKDADKRQNVAKNILELARPKVSEDIANKILENI